MKACGRPSFARAMIEVIDFEELKNTIIVATSFLSREDITIDIVTIEYEWAPPRWGGCKIFCHVDSMCLKKATHEHVNAKKIQNRDGFQQVNRRLSYGLIIGNHHQSKLTRGKGVVVGKVQSKREYKEKNKQVVDTAGMSKHVVDVAITSKQIREKDGTSKNQVKVGRIKRYAENMSSG
ncbi:hypothetical protein Tco_1023950 [Tanacetum coccineum]